MFIKQMVIMKEIYEKFDGRRQEIEHEKRMKRAIFTIMRCMRRFIKKCGVS